MRNSRKATLTHKPSNSCTTPTDTPNARQRSYKTHGKTKTGDRCAVYETPTATTMTCDNPKCGKKIKGPHYRNCWGDFCDINCAQEACFNAQRHIGIKAPCGKMFGSPRKKYPSLPEPRFFEGEWMEK